MKRFLLTAVYALFLFQSFAQKKSLLQRQLIEISNSVPTANASALFKSTFEMQADDKLQKFKTEADVLGFLHDKYQQYYKSIKVDGAVYSTHSKGGLIETISGTYINIKDLDIKPGIAASTALDAAVNHVKAKVYAWEGSVKNGYDGYNKPTGELVIVADDESGIAPVLAYKFDIYAAKPLYRAYVFINAKTGAFIKEDKRIHESSTAASANTLYDGTQNITADFTGTAYRLQQNTSGLGVQTFSLNNTTAYTSATDISSATNVFSADPASNQAHFGAEQTYAYYKNVHDRLSYNNQNSILLSYTHYSTGYVNAFWDGSRMTYGDGDGVSTKPLVCLDVCGHEITHGVTETSANLIYSNESGALNESFSDIFGECIENFAKSNHVNDWLMANEIGINGNGAFRSMMNPKQFNDPDTYKGTYWYTGTADDGGVHTNSGVQNKWFYLLANGGSGINDVGNSYNIAGIGMLEASRIAYRNLTVYLSGSSNYAAARAGSIQAAKDLHPNDESFLIAVTNAWYAVGVGCAYNAPCYCTSFSNSSSAMWISKLNFGTYTNASNGAVYTNFTSTAPAVNADAGSTYAITLTPGYSSTAASVYWKIWIDYNQDGDFEDAGELALSKGLSKTAVTGTITIPTNAGGTTRMRVSMKYNAAQTACENFANGEVEDYTIILKTFTDVAPPSAPVLSSTGATTTTVGLSWTAATDNIGVIGYDVYLGSSKVYSTSTGTSYTLTGLTPGTTYTTYVVAKDATGNSTPSNTLTVTTPLTNTVTIFAHYFETGMDNWTDGGADCARYKGTRSYEGLYSVYVRDNEGPASTMTSQTLDLSAYKQLTLDLYFYAYSMEAGEDFWVQYFDGSNWNNVGVFVAGTHFNNNAFYHATININTLNCPPNAVFRIQSDASDNGDMIYVDAITLKGNPGASSGAVNSQTCTIVTALNTEGEQGFGGEVISQLSVYPNPATTSITITGLDISSPVFFYNATGILVKEVRSSPGKRIEVQDLKKGMYIIKLKGIGGFETLKFIKQ